MIAPSTLAILCCPETHQPVTIAEATLVAQLNERIGAGTLKNRSGKPVATNLDAGLLRQDKTILYPVRNNIPVMLIAEGIPLDGHLTH